MPTIHLIANAHLDPVWLWDWREGMNEGLITVRTMLDLMDKYPEMTFIRGEASVYQFIEIHDPDTFERIEKMVKAGRWEVVGGTLIQPDTNLPSTETFARHFNRGQRYFQQRFGKKVRVAWAADSFGHSAGLPEILAEAGMEGYCFSRPGPGQLTLEKPAFWWEGPSGARVLAYRIPVGWYGAERDEMLRKLDGCLHLLQTGDLENVGCFYGVGNHGGGPTRRHLAEIAQWQKQHPEVTVIHSGLHRLIDALKEEETRHGEGFLPTYRGELNFCLRGCYASVAKFKYLYRKTEEVLASAEKTNCVLGGVLDIPFIDLGAAWDAVLFNSFHDILPGSSIERAYDDQMAWLGKAIRDAQQAELFALNALALRIDTEVSIPEGDHPSPVSLLAWNPHPHPYKGHIELEASLDYRPIWPYVNRPAELPIEVIGPEKRPVPFQVVETEHHAMTDFPWRKRVVVPVTLPPCGWGVYTMAWKEQPALSSRKGSATAPRPGEITNGHYTVQATVGETFVALLRQGQPVFTSEGLHAITVEDPWGSWGGMAEEPESLDLSTVRAVWRVAQVETLETGPERATLWVRLKGGNSRLDLTFSLYSERDAVDVKARVFWDERAARLKLVFPVGDLATFEVPGGQVTRGPMGEVPGGRWVRVEGPNGAFGFASDALYGYDCKDGTFRATVVRAGGYATDVKAGPETEVWRPVVDAGELKFRFLMNAGNNLPRLAQELAQPPTFLLVPSHPASSSYRQSRSGSLMSLEPDTVQVLALKPADSRGGWILRLQETAGQETTPVLRWGTDRSVWEEPKLLPLAPLKPYQIASWNVVRTGEGWVARLSDAPEKTSYVEAPRIALKTW